MSKTHLLGILKPNISFIGYSKNRLQIHAHISSILYFLQSIGIDVKGIRIFVTNQNICDLVFYVKHTNCIFIDALIFENFTPSMIYKILFHELLHYFIDNNSEDVVVFLSKHYNILFSNILYKTRYLDEILCIHCTNIIMEKWNEYNGESLF